MIMDRNEYYKKECNRILDNLAVITSEIDLAQARIDDFKNILGEWNYFRLNEELAKKRNRNERMIREIRFQLKGL